MREWNEVVRTGKDDLRRGQLVTDRYCWDRIGEKGWLVADAHSWMGAQLKRAAGQNN